MEEIIMDESNKMFPKLRFSGFNNQWYSKTLNEIAIINPKSKDIPEKFIYIDLESVNDGILKEGKMISKKDAPSRAQRILLKNDILFQTVRPYQMNNYFFELEKDSYVASTGYAQIRTDQNPKFLYYFLHTRKFVFDVLSRCTGTSCPAINSNDLKTIPIKLPSLEEQNKIASFLTKIDEKIELMQNKHKNKIIFKNEFFNNYVSNLQNNDCKKIKLDKFISIQNKRK